MRAKNSVGDVHRSLKALAKRIMLIFSLSDIKENIIYTVLQIFRGFKVSSEA